MYRSIVLALNEDGAIGETQLKVHFDIIQESNKDLGEISLSGVADFRFAGEVKRELSAKSTLSAWNALGRLSPATGAPARPDWSLCSRG